MNKITFVLLSLALGGGAGTYYGWQSGYRDGQIVTSATNLAIYAKYAEHRSSPDVESRDKVMDAITIATLAELTRRESFSPISSLVNGHIDDGLVSTYVRWMVDHPDKKGIGDPEWDARVAKFLDAQGVTLEAKIAQEKERRANIKAKQK